MTGIFILPLFAISTVVGIVGYIITLNRKFLVGMVISWALIAALIFIVSVLRERNRPMKLTKKDIVGRYRIDTSFYPGKNARWQFERYEFIITPGDSIYWLTTDGNRITSIAVPIVIRDGPPVLWRPRDINAIHFFEQPPILFRSHGRFYYVIHSRKYGNMFFRKTLTYSLTR